MKIELNEVLGPGAAGFISSIKSIFFSLNNLRKIKKEGKSMSPYLSIIVPIYKVENYIHQCINSILSQTFKDFELILVDDGSPDQCPYICDDYAQKDNRIKVIHKKNGGLVSARKAGLEIASGKYVGYVDSDDWIEKDMFEVLCNAARIHNTDIVICDILQSYTNKEIKLNQMIKPGIYDKNKLRNYVYPYMLYSGEFFKFGLFPAVWNKIFNRELLEKNQFNVINEIRMGEDAACTYPCLLDATSIYILEKKYLYHYRQNSLSMTKKYDDKFLEGMLTLYSLLKEINNEKNIFDLSEQLRYYLVFLTIGAVDNEFNKSNKKNYRDKLKYVKDMLLNEEINSALHDISLKDIPFNTKVHLWLLRSKQIALLNLLLTGYRKIRQKDCKKIKSY
jgi:glycosyltransferase involved in cell wall biosynthesis